MKMYLAKSLIVLTCLYKLNHALLKSCLIEQHANRICHKRNEGYLKPFPLNVSTRIELKEIVDINEDEKSITLQMVMVTIWKDSGIDRSNSSDL